MVIWWFEAVGAMLVMWCADRLSDKIKQALRRLMAPGRATGP